MSSGFGSPLKKSYSSVSTETTIYQSLAVQYSKSLNCIAVSSDGKFAALGGKKGLHIVDLDEPGEPTRTLNQQSKWEVTVVEWNPHAARSSFIASTANQNILVWNIEDGKVPLQSTIQTHQRAVSDLSWSLFDVNTLATCSADTYINLWDVRDPKKPIKLKSFCGWTAGASQVKWNRKNPNTLASSHNGEVRIWDIRKVSSPITFITAHYARIFSLDWSYLDENELVTCSEDKQVKFWNSQMPRVCKATLQSGIPVVRARYTPFGSGLLTMNQKSDFTVRLWSLEDLTTPVHQYIGHTDLVTAFDWRCKEINGKKEYQLITWSKDQHLRLWYVDKKQQDSCNKSKQSISSPTNSLSILKKSKAINEDITLAGKSLSPVDKSFSSYGIQDLSQELSFIEKRKPKNISIEESNIYERYCIVSVMGNQPYKMKITFPSLYPHGAAPSFQFLSSNISNYVRSRVIESLSETASFHIENNRPCLYQCLAQLAALIKETTELSQEELNSASSTSVSNTSNSSTSSGGIHPESLPSPRTCGVAFGGVGQLIYFTNFNSHLSGSSKKLRTYRDLKYHLQEITHLTPKEDPNLNYHSNPYFLPIHSKNELLTPFGAPISVAATSSMLSNKSPSIISSTNTSINTNLFIKDCSYLQPLNLNLARGYKLSGGPTTIEDICLHNAMLAEVEARKDLVQLWSLVKLLLHTTVFKYVDDKDPNLKSVNQVPWHLHPLVTSMIPSMFEHYEKLKDVQTLAVLSCILSYIPPPSPSQSNSSSQTEQIQLSQINNTENEEEEETPLVSNITIEKPSKTSSFKKLKTPSSITFTITPPPPPPTANTTKQSPRNNVSSNNNISSSSNNNNATIPTNTISLLDQQMKNRYDQYKQYYADLLYRWQLLDKRSEVLKYVKHQAIPTKTSIAFSVHCNNCGKPTEEESNICPDCKVHAFSCAICHISVRGLSSFCLNCQHGGHAHHMREWFQVCSSCPTGCGCECLENSSL